MVKDKRKQQIMKNFQYKYLLLASLFVTACSDWDDHFDADTATLDSQKATLWENIDSKSNLSEFKTLLAKAGYNENLSASQTYTVWAPVNGSFDYDALSAVGNDRLLKQFVQNHVARNNYPATGVMDQNIYMLNEKLMKFSGSGSDYTIQGIKLDGSNGNIGSSNGTLHLINGKIPFLQNIFESLNNEEYALDSISDYFHHYDVKILDESKSVAGPIVDGEQTYLDSIFYESNTLFSNYRAYINREDSNYTMLMPTNTAWHKARTQIANCYNYIPEFRYIRNNASGNDTTILVTLKDAAQLKDSMMNFKMVSTLFFNNNIGDNTKLKDLKEAVTPTCDSLITTRRDILYGDDAKVLFTDAKRVDKSNGAIWVTDSIRQHPWLSWNPEITIEAEQYVYKSANSDGVDIERLSSAAQNPAIEGRLSSNSYVVAKPNVPSAKPELFFQLPDVRSAAYNIYVVIVPANIANASTEYKPTSIAAAIRYGNEYGRINAEETLKTDSALFTTGDVARIDTLFLGTVTFPIAYYGTEAAPYLRIRSHYRPKNADLYDHTLRVDCIILRPVELDAYIKEHPGYVYDKHQ